MFVIRCANGIVLWLITTSDQDHAALVCQTDQMSVALTRSATSSWEQSLLAVATHSVALKGAIQQILFLPRRIA